MARYRVGGLRKEGPEGLLGDDLPVEQVSWDDAVGFCGRLSEKEGRRYRLPTEAEWEYACRAGLPTEAAPSTAKAGTTDPYAGAGKPEELGWYSENSGGGTHAVGKKMPNGWGLFDLRGNVWEWCEDGYGEYGAGGEAIDPKGLTREYLRVVRGGAWLYGRLSCRSASRDWALQSTRVNGIGFRAALDP